MTEDTREELERQSKFWYGAFKNERQQNLDLRRHLRDRDKYIATLEEQLKPYIGHDVDAGEQEALL